MSTLIKKKKADLLSLNEKCLEKIFDYLEFNEGLNLVEAFDHRLKPMFRNSLNNTGMFLNSDQENFGELIQNYGSHLTLVEVKGNEESLNLLAEFSAEGNLGKLRFLDIFGVNITDYGTIVRSKVILSQLNTLRIQWSEISDDNLGHLLAMCSKLEIFVINLSSDNTNSVLEPMLKIASKNMKSIHLYGYSTVDRPSLIQLLAMHPNLCEFTWDEKYLQPNDIICEMLPKLEKLEIVSKDIGHAIALKQLKTLRIYLAKEYVAEVSNYLTNSSGLRTLKIDFETDHNTETGWGQQQFDGLIDAICTCTSLQELELNGVADVLTNVVKLAESLPLLRSFHLQMWLISTTDSDWLEFVENAEYLILLSIDNDYDDGTDSDIVSLKSTDSTENLRDIIGRREQNYRYFEYEYTRIFVEKFYLDIVGSHVTQKNHVVWLDL